MLEGNGFELHFRCWHRVARHDFRDENKLTRNPTRDGHGAEDDFENLITVHFFDPNILTLLKQIIAHCNQRAILSLKFEMHHEKLCFGYYDLPGLTKILHPHPSPPPPPKKKKSTSKI